MTPRHRASQECFTNLTKNGGMVAPAYAIGTIAAAAFGAILYTVITGDSIVSALTNIGDALMGLARPVLRVGDRVVFDGDEHQVVGLSGTSVRRRHQMARQHHLLHAGVGPHDPFSLEFSFLLGS
jgi:hypothetical protein